MLQSGLPEDVADAESLARFLTSRSQYNSKGPKAAAFFPGAADNKTSVFRCAKDPRDQLWQIARVAIGSRSLYGAAIVSAGSVRIVGLEVEALEPPPRHANIVGWPNPAEDALLNTGRARAIALRLAAEAVLVRASD